VLRWERPFCIFGDSAYKVDTNLRSYIVNPDHEQAKSQWNGAMKRVRISIEWNYMSTATMFRYVGEKTKLQVLASSTVTEVYTVATILRNFHVILYGNQTSNYFNWEFTSNFLEDYVNQV